MDRRKRAGHFAQKTIEMPSTITTLNSCSRISAHLAFGTLSIKSITDE